jgi:hypothetical protein
MAGLEADIGAELPGTAASDGRGENRSYYQDRNAASPALPRAAIRPAAGSLSNIFLLPAGSGNCRPKVVGTWEKPIAETLWT